MNERWERYLSCPPSAPPPLDTRRLQVLQAHREQRRQLALLCLASLLWTILALSLGIALWREGSPLGIVLLGLVAAGLPSGGLMAAALLEAEAKKRRTKR
jgi:hypothetical protein